MPEDTNPSSTLFSTQNRGVLATIKRGGRPQLSNVAFAYDEAKRIIRVSVTDDRAKTRNLRRDPRASFHVTTPDMRFYRVAEGIAELSPVAADPHDATVEELVTLFRTIMGEHENWDEFRSAMVKDRRLVLRLHVERSYGTPAP